MYKSIRSLKTDEYNYVKLFTVSEHIKNLSKKYKKRKITSIFENLACSDKKRKHQEKECILHSFPELSWKCKINKTTNQAVEDIERNESRA